MNTGLVSRSLSRVKAIMNQATGRAEASNDKILTSVRHALQDCSAGRGGDISTQQRVAELASSYLALDHEGRLAFLYMIALDFGPDPLHIETAYNAYQHALNTPQHDEYEAQLRAALSSGRKRILTQFNAIEHGVKFLVDLRTDLLGFLKEHPELKILDHELQTQFGEWFDIGFLQLVRLDWHTPAAILEKIVDYEAVHQIHSWTDLKNRLAADRRCYAFFHPRMPEEPLIFVEVALLPTLADNVQQLLDIHAPEQDAQQATTAIFYSISNTQSGLRGVSFGNFLLKRVVQDLQRDFPKLKTFATLSPIPKLRHWAATVPHTIFEFLTPLDWKRLASLGVHDTQSPALSRILDGKHIWQEDKTLIEALKEPLTRVAAHYLTAIKHHQQPLDPVARFHLGNSARIEQLNWLADTSQKGLRQSWGIMVNYLYDPACIEDNLEAFANDGTIAMSNVIQRLSNR